MYNNILINDTEYYTEYEVRRFLSFLRNTQRSYISIPFTNKYNVIIKEYIENWNFNTIKVNSTYYINIKGILQLFSNQLSDTFKINYPLLNKRYKNLSEFIHECFLNYCAEREC